MSEEKNTLYDFLFMTYWQKLMYFYGFSIRLAYGVYLSRLYVEFRQPIFENLPVFFLKMPFFSPLMSFIGVGRIVSYFKIIHLVFLHIPVAVAELLWTWTNLAGCYFSVLSTYRYNKQIIREFGVQTFLIQHWTRLRAPSLLRTFWISRFCFHIVFVLFSYLSRDDMQIFDRSGLLNETLFNGTEPTERTVLHDLTLGARYMTVRSCETIVAVLGTTGVVSSVGHFVGGLFETFLQDARDDDRNAGALTGVLFLILCLQTNVTGLSADKRVAKLYRNIWLLSMALLHFVHHSLNNLLLRLTTVGNFRYGKHVRALTVSAFLLTAPFLFLFYAWPSANDMFNPWILSVAIFAIELVVKMAVTLITYFLNIIDAKFLGFNPKMDEFVYYVRAFGAVLEFLFGILLFFDGLWILFFEQSGILRAFMICVHAYCNIYLQAVEGWSKLRRRRTAASKLYSLADADQEQIRRYNDVCCICYQDNIVGSTKITLCQHYFHATCLQKWLYVQDKCPLCHKNICVENEHASN